MSTATRFSTRELHGAARALLDGQFRPFDHGAHHTPQRGTELWERSGSSSGVDLNRLVRVRAACSGAGASTTAVALADRGEATGWRVRVVDAASPNWSGLAGATMTELATENGWRRGRRHTILIDRVADEAHVPAAVPPPRSADGIHLTVLDVGWTARELIASAAWITNVPALVDVLVTRRSPVALGQTESVLGTLPEPTLAGARVVVVVIGPSRWNAKELGYAGRLLNQVHDQGGVLFAPEIPLRSLPEIGPQPLPKPLIASSTRLLERLEPFIGSPPAGQK